jgi:hypothetical protein
VLADPVFASSFKDFNRQLQPLAQWRGKVTLVHTHFHTHGYVN